MLLPLTVMVLLTVFELYLLCTMRDSVFYLELVLFYGLLNCLTICFIFTSSVINHLQADLSSFDCLEQHWAVMGRLWPTILAEVELEFMMTLGCALTLHFSMVYFYLQRWIQEEEKCLTYFMTLMAMLLYCFYIFALVTADYSITGSLQTLHWLSQDCHQEEHLAQLISSTISKAAGNDNVTPLI